MFSLYPHQVSSVEHLSAVIRERGAAVDASDTGTGKTLVAVEVMRRLGNPPTVVVCPKVVCSAWERTAREQGLELTAVNYELVRGGKTSLGTWVAERGHRKPLWRWTPEVGFLVFDEVHRCKSWSSLNAGLLRAARRQSIPALGLSATLADSPLELDALGYVLRLHDGHDRPTLQNPRPLHFFSWARRFRCGPGRFAPLEFLGTAEQRREAMQRLHALLFPACGVRVRHADLLGLFPETRITADLFQLGDAEAISRLYAAMTDELAALAARRQNDAPIVLVRMLRMRQEVELLKVPGLVELVRDGLAEGHSVAVFVNFRQTVQTLCQRLGTNCFVDGSQVGPEGEAQRREAQAAFQSGASRVIICNVEAGGVGLDLHDTRGDRPRLALICPGFNAKSLRQTLGRVHRVGGKSLSVQRILFAAGTIEERVYRNVSRKLACLDTLQDGDLSPFEAPQVDIVRGTDISERNEENRTNNGA